jgi:hypothetical protein
MSDEEESGGRRKFEKESVKKDLVKDNGTELCVASTSAGSSTTVKVDILG